jgi:hypothetical protein
MLLFTEDTSDEEAEQKIAAQGGKVIAKIPRINLYLAQVTQGQEMNVINNLRQDPKVILAELNTLSTELETRFYPAEWGSWDSTSKTYLESIKALQGWQIVEENRTKLKDKTRIRILIIDTDFSNPDIYADDLTDRADVSLDEPLGESLLKVVYKLLELFSEYVGTKALEVVNVSLGLKHQTYRTLRTFLGRSVRW